MTGRRLSVLWILGALTEAVGQASGEADLPCRAKRRYYKKAYEEIEKLLDRIDVLIHHESRVFDSLEYFDTDLLISSQLSDTETKNHSNIPF